MNLTELLTPQNDYMNARPFDKMAFRGGEVYGIITTTPVPLIKIGRAASSNQRSYHIGNDLPDAWKEQSLYAFRVQRNDCLWTERQIHDKFARFRVPRNVMIQLLRNDARNKDDEISVCPTGITEWFTLHPQMNKEFRKCGLELLQSWWDTGARLSVLEARHQIN